MATLRIITYQSNDPYFNIAFEESLALVRSHEIIYDTLRIWRNRDSVILGYFNDVNKYVRVAEAESTGVPIIRRFTGGGAVYLDLGCLIYSLAIKREADRVSVHLLDSLLHGTVRAFQMVGLAPSIRNSNDIIINGFKVSGNSASIRDGTIFLHGTMLVNSDTSKIYHFLKVPPEDNIRGRVDPVKYNVSSLSSIINGLDSVSMMNKLTEALIKGYSEILNETPLAAKPTKIEMEVAKILHDEKYVMHEWNYRKASEAKFGYINKLVKDVLSEGTAEEG